MISFAFRSLLGVVAAFALLMLGWVLPAYAQDRPSLNGVALVIGQSKYEHISALPNPANDAREMVKLLTDLGFDARSVSDRDAKKLSRDLERFVEDAQGADVAFLYYSGHGIESGGENWLVPVDADVSSLENARDRLVSVSAVIDELKQSVPVSIVLLDACRTNPFPAGAVVKETPSGSSEPIGTGGLTLVRGATAINNQPDASENLGIVVGFAAEPGRPALDGPVGENSPYASALLRHLSAMDGAEFGSVMRMVTEEVYLDTKARQRPWVNESLRRFLYFGVSPEQPTGDDGLITGERRKLLLTISDLPQTNRLQIETAALKGEVPLDSLYGVLKALGTEQIPEDPMKLGEILDRQAARLKELFDQQRALQADDPEIVRLASAADTAIRQGAIVTARHFLDEAVKRVESTRVDVDAAEEMIKQKRIADAAVYVRRANASSLVFDFEAAASDYAEAAKLVERWDGLLFRTYRNGQAIAFMDMAHERGDPAAYEKALALLTANLDSGEADVQLINRPAMLHNIGVVLQRLGERQGNRAQLQAAADTFREAIQLAGERAEDFTWINAQSSLGGALQALAMHETGPDLLKEAVAANRAALTKGTREYDPMLFARLQNNLGVALVVFAERHGSTDPVTEAETSYRKALEIYTRDKMPVEWAMVQNNLGNALNILGAAQNDPKKYQEAAAAFRAALEIRTREHLPVSWATTRLNLATALGNLTKFDLDTPVLEEAIAAIRDALVIFNRKNFPLDWAAATNNLAATLQTLGQRKGDTATLEESVSTFRSALRVYTRKAFPLDWAMTQYNLGNTLQLLGGMSSQPLRYQEAIAAYRDALDEYTREATPLQWAMAKAGMGSALQWLSNNEEGTESLVDSIAARREALEILTVDNAPVDWANAQNGIGMSLINLGNRERTAKYLDDAQAAFEASLKVFTRADQPLQWAFGQNNLGDVFWNRASMGGGKPDYERAKAYFELAKQGFTEAGYLIPIPLTDKKIGFVQEALDRK